MTDSYKSYVIRGFDRNNNPIYIYDARKKDYCDDYTFCFVSKLYQAQRFIRSGAEEFLKASKHRFASISPKIVPITITIDENEDEIIEV